VSTCRKSTAGYNLTKLFVGSQGTLGVITQAVVKLHARPAVCSVAVCPFLTVNKAVEAAVGTLQCSVPIAKLEFLDANAIAACNKYSKLTLTESPSLFVEFHGSSEAEVAAQASLVEIFASNDGTQFTWLHALEEQKKLWIARHSVHNSILSLKDNLAHALLFIFDGAVVGHVGFGHFRCILLADDSDENQKRVIMELFDHTYRRALAVGGSCAGEFGIGIDQRKYLKTERGEVGVNTMIAIKKALDPNGIMNSKKLFMEI
ncbi:unnamed protein product, partial [Thelazia callipaeda]|uniref:FAD-binding PCMH-type domain-containing protein n=1 Tax=Thelazia callipaeda TaxID=103827 RepID=A0A0N5CT84_THECL